MRTYRLPREHNLLEFIPDHVTTLGCTWQLGVW